MEAEFPLKYFYPATNYVSKISQNISLGITTVTTCVVGDIAHINSAIMSDVQLKRWCSGSVRYFVSLCSLNHVLEVY
jgi:hypothetical protein